MAELDPRFSFESFVVGPANRLASAAARRAAESPGASFNPLFLYAASGLGKTHILGAVARHSAKVHPDKKVVYQTLEELITELAEALEGGDRDGVRRHFTDSDILLLDDVQFLAGQSEAQEMVLRLLDALTGEGKQVMLASDRPPSDIDKLDARLRSRFEGGLLVDIGPPEYETRVAILRKRVEARGQTLGPGVADVIGRVAFRNVRELTGALNRVLAIQELEGREVSAQEAASLVGAERAAGVREGSGDLGQFLEDLTESVAAQVDRQEEPWRRRLREASEAAEARGFRAERLRRLLTKEGPPPELDRLLDGFRTALQRLAEIKAELDAVGNPWPEAAHGVLKDPDRLEEAEALLASARERARPLPSISEGPSLEELGSRVPPLVLRAAEQLIGTDRPEYNPLYLWCSDESVARGVMEAAGRSFLARNQEAEVGFVSFSGFAEDFIGALSSGVAGAWRERWWSAELLLAHGAQQLSGTERAQDEFFHLFEALQRRRARIMVVADRPPARIAHIDDRLRSRFEGGLVLEVELTGREAAGKRREVLRTGGRRSDREPQGATPTTVGPKASPRGRRTEEEGMGGGTVYSLAPEFLDAKPAPEKEWGRGSDPEDPSGPDGPPPGHAEDVSRLDREWILALTGTPGVRLGKAVSDEAEWAGREQADPWSGGAFPGSWFPSPERVVWEWPRLSDRLLEDPD